MAASTASDKRSLLIKRARNIAESITQTLSACEYNETKFDFKGTHCTRRSKTNQLHYRLIYWHVLNVWGLRIDIICLGKPVRGTRCTKNQEYTSMRMTGNICTKLGSISSCVDDLKPAHSFQLNLRKFSEFKTNCLCEILVAGF